MLATFKRQLKRIQQQLGEADAAREPTITLSEEERLAALTRLYSWCAREAGYTGDWNDHESIWRWAQEQAEKRHRSGRPVPGETPAGSKNLAGGT